MKRAIVLATLALSLMFGSSNAYAYPTGPVRVQAFPNGPCISRADQSAASGLSQVQLFLLVLPALVNPIV